MIVFCRIWFRTERRDCSRPAICVTSLSMRKWMRERMQRRKKKTEEQQTTPAAPPLQPAYFEESASPSESHGSEPEVLAAPGSEAETQPAEEPDAAASTTQSRTEQPREGARKTRRRRGGRGRGGRGREKAVAQAFAPAAGKGIVPDAATDEEPSAAADSEVAETPEAETPEAAVVPEPAAPGVPVAIPVAPARPPKGIVVLAIGLPGSGKSSWFKRHNVVPLSTDMLRSLLFDDVREQRFQDLVFSNLRSMLKARLIAKRPMNYVDATNLTPQERHHWIKLAKDYNYEVHAVFFDVPLEVCLERHQRRDRVVPDDVMRRMAAKLKPPSFDEGFAKITVVRVKKAAQESA
jgi:predicted kinase